MNYSEDQSEGYISLFGDFGGVGVCVEEEDLETWGLFYSLVCDGVR